MLNPVHLKTLVEVVRSGSFVRAANNLGFTASAVSQQMSALEKTTGAELFIRTARTITPTEDALTMARHAAKVLTDLDVLMAAAAHSAPKEESLLRIGMFPSLATAVLEPILSTERWRKLGLHLRPFIGEPGHVIQAANNGAGLDAGLVYQVGQGGVAWPGTLKRQWIADDMFRILVPQSWGFAPDSVVPSEQLMERPWIMHHPGTADATVIERLFASLNLHPSVVAHSDDFNASLAMVSAGLGATLVPDLAIRVWPEGAVRIDVPEIRLARKIFALKFSTAAESKTDVFLGMLAELLASPGAPRP